MRTYIFPLLASLTLTKASGTWGQSFTDQLEQHDAYSLIALPSEHSSEKRAIISWDDAYTKATAALAKLSLADKIGIVTGTGWQAGNCVGNTKAASSIGYPSLCLQVRCSIDVGQFVRELMSPPRMVLLVSDMSTVSLLSPQVSTQFRPGT